MSFHIIKTAVLVDGAFFLKRYKHLYWKYPKREPEQVARNLYAACLQHLNPKKKSKNSNESDRRRSLAQTDSMGPEPLPSEKTGMKSDQTKIRNKDTTEPPGTLYRIFYYDCEPLELKIHHPVSQKCIDYSQTSEYCFRKKLLEELKKKRKVAVRMGRLATFKQWKISSEDLKSLIKGNLTASDLTETQIVLDIFQKGVDMKVGIDIASLALKKQVERIVLISGDSDFVPAAKLARREGIDFILDPLWQPVHPSLYEHIDGLRSVVPLFRKDQTE